MSQTLPSVCPLDCPDACSLEVTVEAGHVARVRGSHANPYTAGAICAKVARYPSLVNGPDRVLHPLLREGARGEGRFRRVSWDEALERVHAGISAAIERHGPQSVLPFNYAGPHGVLAGGSMDLRFFHRLGASRLARSPLCGGVKDLACTALYGDVPMMRPEAVADARLIIVWGFNVTTSGLHLMAPIRQALRAGATLVVVDPRRTPIARKAHLHLAPRPGTDVVLGYALAAELERIGGIDAAFCQRWVSGLDDYLGAAREWPAERAAAECGVAVGDIRRLARWYCDTSPAVVVAGNGPERNRNGGSGLRAVNALPALAGKFGVRGGGLLDGAGASFPRPAKGFTGSDLCPPGTRTLNIVEVGRHLTEPDIEPPIAAVFIYNHNPLVVHPDQNRVRRGLAREDLFVVGCDYVMTDSLAFADVVLPACCHFEHADVFKAYGQHWLQRAEAVVPPPGEALPNTEIFRRLAARFGFDEPCFRDDDTALMDQAVDAADARLGGLTGSRLPTDRAIPMTIGGEEAMFLVNTFPATASGRIELRSETLAREYGQPLPVYSPLQSTFPLTLISPGSEHRTSSTFGSLRWSDDAWLDMHPADAARRGLADATEVRVWNDLGEVRLRLRVTDEVRAGVVSSQKGAWLRTSGNGQTVSALAPGHLADLLGGACYNDARVEVAAA